MPDPPTTAQPTRGKPVPPSTDRGPLAVQHRLWLAFLLGVVLLGGVLTVVVDVEPTIPVVLPLLLSVSTAVATAVGVLAIDRTFAATPPADDEAAVGELRTRMVLQAVLAETLVLVTTILAALVGPRWNVAIGATAAVAILLWVRPRPTRLRRFEDAWAAAGSDVSLTRVLDPQQPTTQDPTHRPPGGDPR